MTTQSQAVRVSIRLPCELPAEITFSGGGIEIAKKATISNISTTGIQILSPSFIATGQLVQAAFKIPGQTSKAIFNAEVMRIESLQGRMIGHYPYALGAKFLTPEKKQEKQITHFISKKITCASGRAFAAIFFFTLGMLQTGRVLLHTVFSSSEFAALDQHGFSSPAALNWFLHPVVSGFAALGFLSAALLCGSNKKFFLRWGFFWAAIQISLSLITLYFKRGLVFGNFNDSMLLSGEWLLLILGITLMPILINLRSQLKKIDQILSTDRPLSGPNRPTFTIL